MWTPDKAYALSLPRRADRRAEISALAPRTGFNVAILDAVDGQDLAVPSWWLSSPQAYGNAQSHRMALATAQPDDAVAILEDDAFIPGDFRARLETVLTQAPDWELIMLGGQHVLAPSRHAPGVTRCTGVIRSIGYIARGRAITETIGAIDRSRRHWDNEWVVSQRTLKVYAPDPFIVTPTGSPSEIPDSTPW